MKKVIVPALALILSTTSYALTNKVKTGIHGYTKLHHNFDGLDNDFDPNTGSTYGLKLGYTTPAIENISFTASIRANGDTGLTKIDENGYKVAAGQFMTSDYSSQIALHEATVNYQSHGIMVRVGRGEIDSPLTTLSWTHIKNLYEGAYSSVYAGPFRVNIGYVSKMAYGSRSMADWGLTGEKTQTAGAGVDPKNIRGNFISIGETINANEDSALTLISFQYKENNIAFNLWNYTALNIANTIYSDISYKRNSAKLSFQLINQKEVGRMIDGEHQATLYGVKLDKKIKKLNLSFAYNHNNDNLLLSYGGDPAYTSTIFSRNAYRKDVDAFKVQAKYPIKKNLQIMFAYAHYGKSDNLNVQTDANERDIKLIYKPNKRTKIILFNADRVSEFDGLDGKEKKQNHTRLIAQYSF